MLALIERLKDGDANVRKVCGKFQLPSKSRPPVLLPNLALASVLEIQIKQ